MWTVFKVNACRSDAFIDNFEQISHIAMVFLLLLWTSKCRLAYGKIPAQSQQ